MSVEKKTKRRKKRGVMRTYVDEYGRVRVTKFKRKESRFKNPLKNVKALKGKRLPTTILGTALVGYGAAAQAYSKNLTENYFGGLAPSINAFFDSMDSISKLIFAGVVGVALSVFLGYALITQGIKVNRYGIPFRQLTSVFVAYLVLSSIISPFFNNPGDIRQISDDKFSNRDASDLSVEGLDSPFYDSFKDSLTDLFKNKIPPNLLDDIYLNLTAPSGYSLDPQRDAYLIKWKTEEKWDPVKHTYVAGDTANILDFIERTEQDVGPLGQDTAIKFRARSAFFSIGSSYSGQLLAPWNSEIGPALEGPFYAINNPSGPGYTGTDENVTKGTPTIYNTVNLDPNIAVNLQTSGAKGAIEYYAYWVAEKKSEIISNSIQLKDKNTFITSVKGQFDSLIPNGFFDIISDPNGDYTGIDAEWGKQSLPADYLDDPAAAAFIEQMNAFKAQTGGENATIFSVAAVVTNFIQSKILEQMLNNPNFLDLNQDFSGGAGDQDPAFFFYQAVKPNSNLQWGVTDIMPAYINMLRMLGVPARMVTGFAGGNIVGDTIQYSLNNILLWAEVLIPWESNGQKHLSWAMFNPSPIPSLFKDRNIVTYGRNALGGDSTVKVNIDSGAEIGGAPAKLQYMGEKFKFSANVMYDTTPAVGVSVAFNLLDSTELAQLQNNGIGTAIPGTPLGSYTTNDTGWVTVSADVDFNGFLKMQQDPKYNATVSGVDLTAFTQGDQAGSNAYAIVAIVGFSFGVNVTGWLKNGTLTVSSTLDPVTLPGVNAVGYVSAPYQNITINGLLQNTNKTQPIQGENISFYILDKTAFDSLDFNNPDLNVLTNTTMITRVSGGTNPNPFETDTNGRVSFTINFNDPFGLTPGTDDIYFIIAMWEGSLVISDPIALLITLQSSMSTTASFPSGVPIVTTTTPGGVWSINTTALTTTALLSQPQPLEGIEVLILAVDKFDYDALGTITTYAQFESQVLNAFTEGSNMYKLHDVSTYGTSINGSRVTNAQGKAIFTISVHGDTMRNGYYYLFIYSTDLQKFNQVYNGSNPFLFAKTDALPLAPAGLEPRQLVIEYPQPMVLERVQVETRRLIE